MTRRRLALAAAAALVGLSLFSLVFSLLAENGRWPELRPGALHDTDLVAGFAAAIGIVLLLAFARRREPPASREPTDGDS